LSENKGFLYFLKDTLLAGFRKDAGFFSRAIVVIFLTAVLALAASTSYIYSNQEFLIFKFPPKEFKDDLSISERKTINLSFDFEDGKVYGWLFKKEDSDNLLIYFCGVEDNATTSIRKLRWLSSFLDCSILCFDYPGYGKSHGSPSEKVMDNYIQSLNDFFKEKNTLSKKNVLLWGYNMGGAIALKFNQTNIVDITVLESTFSSIQELAYNQFFMVLSFIPFNIINRNSFDNLSLIKNIKNPAIIIHSENDLSIPFEHAQKLQEVSDQVLKLINTSDPHKINYINRKPSYKLALKKYLSNWFY
jgi:uncharacterized protein